jgi:predicted permease
VTREIDEEQRFHLEARTADLVRGGLARDAAESEAARRFGNRLLLRDESRDVKVLPWVESVVQDARYALRGLRKSRGFTFAATLTLALGIGATTAIFGVMDALLLKPLPVRDPASLVFLRPGGFQYPAFQAFQARTDLFVDLLATSGITLLDVEVNPGTRELSSVSLVSGSFFATLGVQPALGRLFDAGDDRVAGEHPMAVLSDGYWERRFGRDAAVLNRVVRIGGVPLTIIGVAPPEFFGETVGAAPDLWVPLTMWGHVVAGRNLLGSPRAGWLRIIGRLRPDSSVAAAQPVLTEAYRQLLEELFGPAAPADVRRDIARTAVTLVPAARGISDLRASLTRPLQLLLGAVGVVLLIACGNLANLLLARATARRGEFDLRIALGMDRSRLIRQLLTESLVLAALGGSFGIGVAWLGKEALLRLISMNGARLPLNVTTDARLLAFVALTSLATAFVFGLAPAWHSARAVRRSLVTRSEVSGRSSQKLGSALVAAQVALSLALVMCAGLILQTIANLRDVDLGFTPQQLLVADVNTQSTGYTGDASVALNRRLVERISAIPGVAAVSLSEHGVLGGRDSTTDLMRPDRSPSNPDESPKLHWDVVGPGYFSVIGQTLVAGRDFSAQDVIGSPSVVAINEDLARRFFQDASPIGRHLRWTAGGAETALEIIAVARDVKQNGPRAEPELRFYLPYLQLRQIRPGWTIASSRFLVRTIGEPSSIVPALRQTIAAEDQRLSTISIERGSDLVSRTIVQERATATLLVAFGALAIGLACLGVYGLIAYDVVRRTSEIGIRMALGAERRTVLWSTLDRGLRWIAIGLAAGIPLALIAARAARSLFFGLGATDVDTLIAAATLMAALGVVAAFFPARRATRIDPLQALRYE